MTELRRLGGEGILNTTDLDDLKAGVRRVFDLMQDGDWYDRNAICLAAGTDGIPAYEGMRRMRELREWFTVERKRLDGRYFVYRLRPKIEADLAQLALDIDRLADELPPVPEILQSAGRKLAAALSRDVRG